ncbi:hypothetical protein B0H16DRAFT_1455467 [Mycena metata]|uniref:Uncharacterized protein n=1 Tax=Mycena metata TaxID=1033252 RepID=A0AAD7JF34_9AGAR|nr:hypothetical protein B0H16DRAFT_1455467 [Mycena metata]
MVCFLCQPEKFFKYNTKFIEDATGCEVDTTTSCGINGGEEQLETLVFKPDTDTGSNDQIRVSTATYLRKFNYQGPPGIPGTLAFLTWPGVPYVPEFNTIC